MKTIKKLTLAILLMIGILSFISVNALEIGPNYDKQCSNGICTYNIYSNVKYYQENGIWKEINESFGTENCALGYDYCVDRNLYQFHIKGSYGSPMVAYGSTKLSFDFTSFSGLGKINPQADIRNNVVVYRDIYPNIDLKYTYLPTKMKEEIIIKNRALMEIFSTDLVAEFKMNTYGSNVTISGNSVLFSDNGNNAFLISNLVAYDEFDFINLNFTASKVGNEVTFRLTIPIDWLKNESRIYPVVIDPTIELTYLDVRWNGFIKKRENPIPVTWTRSNNPADVLKAGREKSPAFPSFLMNDHRASIEWNITPLPTDSKILEINLTLYVEQVGTHGNEIVNISHMEGNNDTYTNDNAGNEQFFIDMSNGTLYNRTNLTLGFNSINLTLSALDVENKLANNNFSFGIGIDGLNENTAPSTIKETWISPRDDTISSQRPVLTFKINSTDEDNGNLAIKQSVLNTIPNSRIYNNIQIYIRLANGTQQLGRFDKFVISGNKAYAINYVTQGESFTDMNNITNALFVMEMQDLTALQIRQQVRDFIKGTLS